MDTHHRYFNVGGIRAVRLEDPRLIRGQGNYASDWNLEGQLHAVFLRSDRAHARIVSIDTAKARALSGVRLIATGEDAVRAGFTKAPSQLNYTWADGSKESRTATDYVYIIDGSQGSGLFVSKRLLSPAAPKVGDLITYRIIVTNVTASTISVVPLSDSFPAGCMAFASATIPPTSVTPGMGISTSSPGITTIRANKGT